LNRTYLRELQNEYTLEYLPYRNVKLWPHAVSLETQFVLTLSLIYLHYCSLHNRHKS